jgi:PBP1b-binding outer membrane lipoprotein LpoB
MKKVLLILGLFLIIFGCVSPTLNQATLEDFENLKEEYGVSENFSPDLASMNDYITDLTNLSTRSSFSLANITQTEIYSAKSFYYYSLATRTISYINTSGCDELLRNDLKNYLDLTINNSNLAINNLETLPQNELDSLRENQKEIIENIRSNSRSYLSSFNQIC